VRLEYSDAKQRPQVQPAPSSPTLMFCLLSLSFVVAGNRAARCTAVSDWSSVPNLLKDKADRKNGMWILEAPTPEITEHYILGEQIGQPGQFGRALKVIHKATGGQRAVKIVSKTKFTRTADKKVEAEQAKTSGNGERKRWSQIFPTKSMSSSRVSYVCFWVC
jgi:hypothetical protein